jgi:hypothetical protein
VACGARGGRCSTTCGPGGTPWTSTRGTSPSSGRSARAPGASPIDACRRPARQDPPRGPANPQRDSRCTKRVMGGTDRTVLPPSPTGLSSRSPCRTRSRTSSEACKALSPFFSGVVGVSLPAAPSSLTSQAGCSDKHSQPSSRCGLSDCGCRRWEQVPERRPTIGEVRRLLRAVGEEQGVVVEMLQDGEGDEEQGLLSSPLLGE